jgi:hypothetical protein
MTGCQGLVVAVENGPVVFQAAVGAFCSVRSRGSFTRHHGDGRHRTLRRRVTLISGGTPVAQGKARMTVVPTRNSIRAVTSLQLRVVEVLTRNSEPLNGASTLVSVRVDRARLDLLNIEMVERDGTMTTQAARRS